LRKSLSSSAVVVDTAYVVLQTRARQIGSLGIANEDFSAPAVQPSQPCLEMFGQGLFEK
jgi:hypothetical protein